MRSTMNQDKIKLIDEHILELQNVIQANDIEAAKKMQRTIIGVYGLEITDIKSELDSYSPSILGDCQVDYIGDAKLIEAKLKNFRANLSTGFINFLKSGGNSVSVTQTVRQEQEQEQEINTSITIEQVVSAIQEIPVDVLSVEDKDTLIGKLTTISAARDKKTKWEKAQSALKWIADKGVEVGIAALPYIVKAISGA